MNRKRRSDLQGGLIREARLLHIHGIWMAAYQPMLIAITAAHRLAIALYVKVSLGKDKASQRMGAARKRGKRQVLASLLQLKRDRNKLRNNGFLQTSMHKGGDGIDRVTS